MKHKNEDPVPYMYDTLQLSFLTTHYESADDYTDQFTLYTVPQYITQKKHPCHDNYLYRRWNNLTTHKHKTKKTRTNHPKDDTSVAPTLETLYTINTTPRQHGNADMLLSITIWNQPIVQYRLPTRPSAPTRNRSWEHPSTAVQYVLIGVYNKLLIPSKLPCRLPLLYSII